MKVTIVRGGGLSKWEMQSYEPLIGRFEILGIGSKKLVNDCQGITFPVKKLWCPAQDFDFLPKLIPVCFHIFGDTQWLVGFEEAAAGSQLIHSAELRNGYTLQAVRAKKKGLVKAVTLTVFENISFLGDEYQARRMIKQEVIPLIDHFLAVNEQVRQTLILEGVSKERISIVPLGVDTAIFRPPKETERTTLAHLREKLGIEKNDFVVLGVGRLVWEKGWYDVVRAAARIKQMNLNNIKFLLIGSGSEEKSLRDFIQKHKLAQSVILAGSFPYHQMPWFFRLADIFVHASIPTRGWNEQFGAVLIEAMASGLSIVGTLSGSIKETVSSGAIFVAPQDFVQLSDAILTFYNNSDLRKNIGLRNRKKAVRKYDIKIVAKTIKTIWEKALEHD